MVANYQDASLVRTVAAAAVAAVTSPPQITFGEDDLFSVAIVIARLSKRPSQQIQIDLLKCIGGTIPRKFIRMKEVREQFCSVNYARARSREE